MPSSTTIFLQCIPACLVHPETTQRWSCGSGFQALAGEPRAGRQAGLTSQSLPPDRRLAVKSRTRVTRLPAIEHMLLSVI